MGPSNLNRGQDTHANRTRHTTNSSTQPSAIRQPACYHDLQSSLLMFENNARKRRGEREEERCRSLRDVMITCKALVKQERLPGALNSSCVLGRAHTPGSPHRPAPLCGPHCGTNRQQPFRTEVRRTKRSPVFSFMIGYKYVVFIRPRAATGFPHGWRDVARGANRQQPSCSARLYSPVPSRLGLPDPHDSHP